MTRFNTRVFCGACLVLAAVAYAAEVDFVCGVANSSSIVCADCNNFCSGCGITCNADGHITGMFVLSSFFLPFCLFFVHMQCFADLHSQWTDAMIETLPETIADLTALESLFVPLPHFLWLFSNSATHFSVIVPNSNLKGNKLAILPAGLKGLKYLSVVFVNLAAFFHFSSQLLHFTFRFFSPRSTVAWHQTPSPSSLLRSWSSLSFLTCESFFVFFPPFLFTTLTFVFFFLRTTATSRTTSLPSCRTRGTAPLA